MKEILLLLKELELKMYPKQDNGLYLLGSPRGYVQVCRYKGQFSVVRQINSDNETVIIRELKRLIEEPK